MLLDAPFTAVTQIIIYAGAIMVLFLFVVMLLNVSREEPVGLAAAIGPRSLKVGAVLSAALGVEIVWALSKVGLGWFAQDAAATSVSSVALIGKRPLHPARVRVRGDVDPDSRRDGRRGRHRAQGALIVVPLNYYLILSGILFAIGTAGVFLRRNLITMLLSVEIMLNAVNLTFVAVGRYLGTVDGQIIVFFVMTVAAAEAAVGLALVIALFRHRETLNPDAFTA